MQANNTASKGSISQLQEFIQGARSIPMPANCPVLHWSHDTRTLGTGVEFRATVSFLLDGVPHHTAGAWKTSKKHAQRDVSERVLDLLIGQWGRFLCDESDVCEESRDRTSKVSGAGNAYVRRPAHDLDVYCTRIAAKAICSAPPRWSCVEDDGRYQAFVEITLFGIPHTFPGKQSSSKDGAYDDVARRALWYFAEPGYEDAFEPDLDFTQTLAHDIPKPAACWCKDSLC